MEMTHKTTVAELRLRPHYSHSALSLYTACSLAFFFRYIAKIPSEHTSKTLLFGVAYHRTLDRLASTQMDDRTFTISDAKEIFRGEWAASVASAINPDFESNDEPTMMLRQGQAMLEAYLPSWRGMKILSHAQAFIMSISDASGTRVSLPIIGEYDLVIEQDGHPVIVDFKTSAKKWSEDKPSHDHQATLYCYSYSKLNGTVPKFRFDVVTKTKTPGVHLLETVRNGNDFQRLAKLHVAIDRAIQNKVLLPNEGCMMCANCEYSHACKCWHHDIRVTTPAPGTGIAPLAVPVSGVF
jgi:CRISPR/Cas system-associated exonuclease Cas4 (RecB family)